MLEHIQGVIRYARQFEQVFVKQVRKKSAEEQMKLLAEKRKMLQKAQERIEEIDRLFKRIYEDNVSGRLSEERYAKLSADYETEQKDLQNDIDLLCEMLGSEKFAHITYRDLVQNDAKFSIKRFIKHLCDLSTVFELYFALRRVKYYGEIDYTRNLYYEGRLYDSLAFLERYG